MYNECVRKVVAADIIVRSRSLGGARMSLAGAEFSLLIKLFQSVAHPQILVRRSLQLAL